MRCESNSLELERYSVDHGLKLASDADATQAIGLVEAAISDVIEPYPFLTSAISELVWRCHIVVAQGDDYDASFSDPAIPFSIFISVTAQKDRSSILRVAENLVHETMHLQLTLFEELSPLIDTTSAWSMYSPWKQQNRPAQGILHGLYVFHVLRWMWRQVLQTTTNKIDQAFSIRRISEIDEQICSVRDFQKSPLLTEAGKQFLRALCDP